MSPRPSIVSKIKSDHLIIGVFYFLFVTVLPTWIIASVNAALAHDERKCIDGPITRFHYNSPHIQVRTGGSVIFLDLPSDPLSLNKRIVKKQYPLQEGDTIHVCYITYSPFDQKFATSIKNNRNNAVVSEGDASKTIRRETSITPLAALNVASYALIFFMIFLNKEKK